MRLRASTWMGIYDLQRLSSESMLFFKNGPDSAKSPRFVPTSVQGRMKHVRGSKDENTELWLISGVIVHQRLIDSSSSF